MLWVLDVTTDQTISASIIHGEQSAHQLPWTSLCRIEIHIRVHTFAKLKFHSTSLWNMAPVERIKSVLIYKQNKRNMFTASTTLMGAWHQDGLAD
jgi:hypothetical protein